MTTNHANNHCERCGVCCTRGGPALHQADRELLESGQIPLAALYTIRKGEPTRDDIRQRVTAARSDIIKIKGCDDKPVCHYYSGLNKACTIHPNRPLECRLLNCRDTRALELAYSQERLTRRDLLEGVAGLWDLVCDHEARCGYEAVRHLARMADDASSRKEAHQQLLHLIRYDHHLRDLISNTGKLDAQMLPFLLGRPLTETVRALGIFLKIQHHESEQPVPDGSQG